jgi:uncharacterized protein DUF3309
MAFNLHTILLIIVLLLLIGALPVYPYSRNWGYAPSGTLTVVLVIVILFLVL